MVAHELDDQIRTYHVVSCGSDGRCNLAPPPDAPHLPEIQNCEQWIMGGATFVAHAGDEALVVKRDKRGTRPVIIGFRRKSGSGTSGFPQSARVGDFVQSGGIKQACNFSNALGLPVVMMDPTGSSPMPGPYLVSFGALPGPVPPTLVSAGPLYGTVASGSNLLGVKTNP